MSHSFVDAVAAAAAGKKPAQPLRSKVRKPVLEPRRRQALPLALRLALPEMAARHERFCRGLKLYRPRTALLRRVEPEETDSTLYFSFGNNRSLPALSTVGTQRLEKSGYSIVPEAAAAVLHVTCPCLGCSAEAGPRITVPVQAGCERPYFLGACAACGARHVLFRAA